MAKIGTADNPLRVGVFQLGYHPSAIVSGKSALEEPLGRLDAESSLSPLRSTNVGLSNCLSEIQTNYLKWAEYRCQQLLSWLHSLPDPPHVVVFPEFSIPFEHLDLFANCSKTTGIAFFAGTHTLLQSSSAQTKYKKQLNVGAQALSALISRNVRSVLPIIDNGKTTLIAKQSPSPFEQDECEVDPTAIVTREVVTLSFGLTVAPMICADAMRLSNWTSKEPDLAVIIALDRDPARFQKYIQHFVEAQIPVAFANTGQIGGSGIFSAVDNRGQHWWWSPPNSGQLPTGDAYLEVCLNLSSRAVQVQTTIPATPARLHRVCQVITAGTRIDALETQSIKLLAAEDEIGLRAALDTLDGREPSHQLFLRRWNQLDAILRSQGAIADWKSRIGESIVLNQTVELAALESQFCSAATKALGTILANADSLSIAHESLGLMTTLMARFKRISTPEVDDTPAPPLFQLCQSGDWTLSPRFVNSYRPPSSMSSW